MAVSLAKSAKSRMLSLLGYRPGITVRITRRYTQCTAHIQPVHLMGLPPES